MKLDVIDAVSRVGVAVEDVGESDTKRDDVDKEKWVIFGEFSL